MLYSTFVGNLDKGISKAELKELFSRCGKVKDIFIHPGSGSAYGFVRYDSIKSVMTAVAELNHWPVRGKPLRVEVAIESQEYFTSSSFSMTTDPDVIKKDIIIRAQVKEACIEVNEQLDVKKGNVPIDSMWVLERMRRTGDGPIAMLTGKPSPGCCASLEQLQQKHFNGECNFSSEDKTNIKARDFFTTLKQLTANVNSLIEESIDEDQEIISLKQTSSTESTLQDSRKSFK